jgi:hypothetical protein
MEIRILRVKTRGFALELKSIWRIQEPNNRELLMRRSTGPRLSNLSADRGTAFEHL